MQFPCEILVRNILPAVKAIMVKELVTNYGKSQKDVAEILGITQPSVSYYLHGTRGGTSISIIKENQDTYDKILELTAKLAEENIETKELLREICGICLKIRSKFIEKLYPEKFEFLKEWNVCFIEEKGR